MGAPAAETLRNLDKGEPGSRGARETRRGDRSSC